MKYHSSVMELPGDTTESRKVDSPVVLEAVFEFGKAHIGGLMFSGTSNLIQAVDTSLRVTLIDPTKKQILRQFRPSVQGGVCTDWTTDGRHLAVGTFGGTEIFDVWTGERIVKIRPHVNLISQLAWSNDRRTLAVGVRSIKLWDTAAEKYTLSLDGHQDGITAMAWNKENTLLASADQSGELIVWDVASGNAVFRMSQQTNMVCSLAWSPDSRFLAIPIVLLNPLRYGVALFDFQEGKVAKEMLDFSSMILAVKFRPSGGPFGDLLITKETHQVRLWRYGTWECLCSIPETWGNYVKPAVALHPFAPLFCTLDNKDTAVRLWKYDPTRLMAVTEPCVLDLSKAERVQFSEMSAELNPGHNERKFIDLVKKVEEAKDPGEKGTALENLCKELFLLHKGFKVESNVKTVTEEIDLTIQQWGRGVAWLEDHAFYILGECKNWSGKCGRPEYSIFKDKLRNRRGLSTLGFLISWNGFADTVELESLRGGPKDPVIALLSGSDLKEIAEKGNLLELLFRAYDKAVMR